MVRKLVFLAVFLLFLLASMFSQNTLPNQGKQLSYTPQPTPKASQQAETPPAPPVAEQSKPVEQPAPVEQAKPAEPAKPAEQVTPPVQAPQPPAHTPKYKVLKVGDSIEVKGVTFTLNDIKLPMDNNGQKPGAGKIYLVLEMNIANAGDEQVAINPMMLFQLKDETGSYSPEPNGQLSGMLGPGRNLEGQLLFQVPAQTQYFTLEIDASTFGGEVTLLEISKEK
ncbi:MAG TPA: DUF4352 domain-containing protein [Candidatus Deferrimicrobium sp.]|nr:DUF4352 domain-containing protein [Candidatus Deferrimicrobium sp.]